MPGDDHDLARHRTMVVDHSSKNSPGLFLEELARMETLPLFTNFKRYRSVANENIEC